MHYQILLRGVIESAIPGPHFHHFCQSIQILPSDIHKPSGHNFRIFGSFEPFGTYKTKLTIFGQYNFRLSIWFMNALLCNEKVGCKGNRRVPDIKRIDAINDGEKTFQKWVVKVPRNAVREKTSQNRDENIDKATAKNAFPVSLASQTMICFT